MSRGGSVRPDAPDETAAERLRERRHELGITQEALAAAAGVSRQTIIATERGDYAPSVYLALRIAHTLDTTVEALWGRPAPASSAQRTGQVSHSTRTKGSAE
jgi:putative transcriptional regulator